jgi:hypothetical protein
MLSFGRCSSCSRHSESTELNVHWCKANFLHYASLPDSTDPYIVTFLPSRVVQSAVVNRLDMDGNGATHALMHLCKKSKNLSCWPLQKAPDCQFQPVDSCSQLRLLTLDICWHLSMSMFGLRKSDIMLDWLDSRHLGYKSCPCQRIHPWSGPHPECLWPRSGSLHWGSLPLAASGAKFVAPEGATKRSGMCRYVFHFSWNIFIVCNVT